MRAQPLVVLLFAGCAAPLGTGSEEPPVAFEAIAFETELGAFTAILFCGETPKTCDFMRGLVERRYYDGRAFGRVIPGFVIQEVDRTGGTTDQPQLVDAEFGTNVTFSAGALGIARGADPNSGGSEFFVMDFATSRLYGNYTAFAQVVDGMEVVHAIARVPAVKTGPASSVAGAPPGSPVSFGIHDRVPVDPPQMTRATMTTIEMPAATAARYPMRVAETYATDTLRATLEWPRDLAMGNASALSWYVFPRDASTQGQLQDPPPLDLAGARIRYDGAASGELAFVEDPAVRGALRFAWTPPAAGSYRFHLNKDGADVAVANVTLQR